MKRIRVTVTEEYLIPDDWKILNHPHGKIPCLHGDNKYFLPYLAWTERSTLLLPREAKSTLRTVWTSVDHDRSNWFIGQMETSDAEFEEIR